MWFEKLQNIVSPPPPPLCRSELFSHWLKFTRARFKTLRRLLFAYPLWCGGGYKLVGRREGVKSVGGGFHSTDLKIVVTGRLNLFLLIFAVDKF